MIDTNSMYYAAYLLTRGCRLTNATSRPSKQFGETVYFFLKGPDLIIEKKMEWDYEQGLAEVNIQAFLANLDKMRDVLCGLRPDGYNTSDRHAKKQNTTRTHKNQGSDNERGRTGRSTPRY